MRVSRGTKGRMGRGVQCLNGVYAIRREQKFAPPAVLSGAQIPSTTTASLWRERVAWRSKPTMRFGTRHGYPCLWLTGALASRAISRSTRRRPGRKREGVRVRSRHIGGLGRDESIRRCSRSLMFHDDGAELVFHVKQRRWGASICTGVCSWSSCLLVAVKWIFRSPGPWSGHGVPKLKDIERAVEWCAV